MDFLPSVIRAQYEGDFRIHFTFSDNVQGTVDLQSWLEGPIFEPLKDRATFSDSSSTGARSVWPNGADFTPETLHEAVKLAGAAQQRAGADVSG